MFWCDSLLQWSGHQFIRSLRSTGTKKLYNPGQNPDIRFKHSQRFARIRHVTYNLLVLLSGLDTRHRIVQRRLTPDIPGIDVGTLGEQQFNASCLATLTRCVQRRKSTRFLSINVGIAQQQLSNILATSSNGQMDRAADGYHCQFFAVSDFCDGIDVWPFGRFDPSRSEPLRCLPNCLRQPRRER